MKKALFFLLLLVAGMGVSKAQKVCFKKGQVLVDKKECLEYSENWYRTRIMSEKGKQIIEYKIVRPGHENDGMYTEIIFVQQKKSLTTRSEFANKKAFIRKLIEEKILDGCKINTALIDDFISRYDEKVDKRKRYR